MDCSFCACVATFSKLKSLRTLVSSGVSWAICQEARPVILDKFVIQSMMSSRKCGKGGINFS